jgi:hypothetical protein
MSRKIYNRLSFMAVSWLDESTLEFRSGALTVLGASITLKSLHTATETHRETHG